MTHVFVAKDGRRLSAEEWGNPRGYPVFLMHGTPGSRMAPRPRGLKLYPQGIRLLAYDRPGYGGSDRMSGRTVADAAADVEAIADALDIGRFAVVGRSGGGPHALACAALSPDRVSGVAVLVGIAPRDALGPEWQNGMASANQRDYAAAGTGAEQLSAVYEARAAEVRADPASMLAFLDPHLPEADRRVVADHGIKAMLESNYAEALRGGAAGWIDDTLAFLAPWGFSLDRIKVPVHLWHGTEDVFSPIEHSRWLAGEIRHAKFTESRGSSHFTSVTELPTVLRRLVAESLFTADRS